MARQNPPRAAKKARTSLVGGRSALTFPVPSPVLDSLQHPGPTPQATEANQSTEAPQPAQAPQPVQTIRPTEPQQSSQVQMGDLSSPNEKENQPRIAQEFWNDQALHSTSQSTSSSAVSDNLPIQNIDGEGDLFLCPEGKVRLRVSSKILSTASSVFAAMFGPHWREGQQLNAFAPPTIPFPEDDATALELLCKALYYRLPLNAQEDLDTETILNLCILIDKWDIKATVLSPSIFRRISKSSLATEKYQLLMASYLMNNAEAFQHTSEHVILWRPVNTTFSQDSKIIGEKSGLGPNVLYRKFSIPWK